MTYVSRLLLLAMFFLVTACTTSYTKNVSVEAMQTLRLMDSHRLVRTQTFTLHRSSKIYLKTLGSDNDEQEETSLSAYQEKQHELEQALLESFLATFPYTLAGEPAANLQQAFAEAAALQADVLVHPYFAEPDHTSEPDDFRFTLAIFDVTSYALLEVIQVRSTGHWFAGDNNLQVATKVAIQNITSM